MPDLRRETLLAQLRAHTPVSQREASSLRRTIGLVSWLGAPFDEDADPIHVTASAIVTDRDDQVLLHRHKRLGIWLQPGGHVDNHERPEDGVLREVREETGLLATHPAGEQRLLHIDVHPGPKGHVHLDVRYLLHADPATEFAPGEGESTAIAWVSFDEAARRSDVSVADALRAVASRR